jgi:3-deoxy-D-manno-octulosonate 8-phosphate phosphatase (KDO 8-P phosphatase)
MPEQGHAELVELLCLDVDGVLTDGSINLDDMGVETKRFHVRDGTALRIWMDMGFHVAIITGRRGMVVRYRATELGIKHVIQGSTDKHRDFKTLLESLEVQAAESAMLGDDLPDLSVMRACGYPIAVADAVVEVKQIAAFTTVRPGGHGAVREAIEHLLKAKGRWNQALAMFD